MRELLQESRALLEGEGLVAVTPEDIKAVRDIAKKIAKKHGTKFQVRKGTGSMKGSVLVMGGESPEPDNPGIRIDLASALLRAGYESMFAPTHGLENHHIRLARQWGHSAVNFALMKKR